MENGRKKKKRKKTWKDYLGTFILIVAIGVLGYSGFQLFGIYKEYNDGSSEYESIQKLAVKQLPASDNTPAPSSKLQVDFNALREINPDTVAWIYFEEPAEINYPVVHGTDNEKYLTKTFEVNDNKLGTLFVDCNNLGDFTDRNTFIYGHNMKNKTMFAQLLDYKEKEFYDQNPYFYIYTPDGMEKKYQIFSAGIVKDTSDSYRMSYASDEEFQQYIEIAKAASLYDTGVEVTTASRMVSLSTCTNVKDDERFLVQGVLISETPVTP